MDGGGAVYFSKLFPHNVKQSPKSGGTVFLSECMLCISTEFLGVISILVYYIYLRCQCLSKPLKKLLQQLFRWLFSDQFPLGLVWFWHTNCSVGVRERSCSWFKETSVDCWAYYTHNIPFICSKLSGLYCHAMQNKTCYSKISEWLLASLYVIFLLAIHSKL